MSKHGGVVAAGHPLSAEAGAAALRTGGNAVDAALAALLASFAAEPLLTGLGAGGYMLVAGADCEPVLLDFFVDAPPLPAGPVPELEAVDVSFGDAEQAFFIGPASCGVYGMPAGVCAASRRWGSMDLAELAEPAVRMAREGVPLNSSQAYVAAILRDLLRSSPECAALWAPGGRILQEGDLMRNEELAQALLLLAGEGSEPFYRGEIARRVCDWLAAREGLITAEALAAYEAKERDPLTVPYRACALLTNPPPAAGGLLLALALLRLGNAHAPPGVAAIVAAMDAAQDARTPEFLSALSEIGYGERKLAAELARLGSGSRLGATTHISVLDGDGLACSVTTTNGEGSAVVVPGTGMHLNNVMGEEDLSPLGFHSHHPGSRMPSMMAPSVLMQDGRVRLVVGSAGSNRIRSAILQAIIGAVDFGRDARGAVCAPRLHAEGELLFHEPGIEVGDLTGRQPVAFRERNLFFGGVQMVQVRDGILEGAGDPRRGGAAVAA